MDELVRAATYLIPGVTTGFVYALIALGFVLIYKCAGVFNLALGEMVMFAPYLLFATTAMMKLPTWIGIVLTLVCLGAIGLVTERIFTRPLIGQSLLSMVMMTLALGTLLRGVMILGWGSDEILIRSLFPSGGVSVAGTVITWDFFGFMFFSLLLLGAMTIFFRYSRTGLAMMVVSEDQQAAQALGLSVTRIMAISWVVAAITAAIGGILLTSITTAHYEQVGLGMTAIAVALLGGLESIPGVIVGGLLIGVIQGLAVGYIDPYVPGSFREVSVYIVLMLVLLIRPHGLFGWERIERV